MTWVFESSLALIKHLFVLFFNAAFHINSNAEALESIFLVCDDWEQKSSQKKQEKIDKIFFSFFPLRTFYICVIFPSSQSFLTCTHMAVIRTFKNFFFHHHPKHTYTPQISVCIAWNISKCDEISEKKNFLNTHTPRNYWLSRRTAEKNVKIPRRAIKNNTFKDLRLDGLWEWPAFHRCLIFHVFNLFLERLTIHIC